jgi:2'-5' RNA ligase
MDTKKLILEALRKKPKRVYEYGCVMVYLNLDENDWNKIQDMIDEDDLYLGDKESGTDGGFGRELDPHVTILFGIHDDVPDEDVELRIKEIKKPEVELQKVSTFENELFDVLKFDVKSKDLHEYNKKFKELPHTTSYPNYHPHATICYLKKGMGEKYKKKLSEIDAIVVTPDKIVYSKPNGKKKNYKIDVKD